MMGWIILLMLVCASASLILWLGRPDRASAQFIFSALLLALAGYAWQGNPGLAGSPKSHVESTGQLPDTAFSVIRQDMLGRFNRAWGWLNMSDTFARRGDTYSAVEIVRAGLRSSPRDPDLWVGLGNALVVHSEGMITPAAQLAFERANRLAPQHPGPRFFYGLALAQGGRFDEAERIWQQLVAEAPPQAQYRAIIVRQLDALRQARAASAPPVPGPALPPQ